MKGNEEARKIQFTGKSSYIVSLPKQWIVDLGLKQGDQVIVARQGSSGLKIFPSTEQVRSSQVDEATFEIGSDDKDSLIVRKLVSLYFLGFKTINIIPKNERIKPSQRTVVKDAV